jgi:hypothetical protein
MAIQQAVRDYIQPDATRQHISAWGEYSGEWQFVANPVRGKENAKPAFAG